MNSPRPACLLGCLAMILTAATACNSAPPPPPTAIEVLKAANAAARKLNSVLYDAEFSAEGPLANQVPPMKGKVQARRAAAGAQSSFRIDGSMIKRGNPPEAAQFQLAFDGKNVYTLEAQSKTFASGPVEGGMGISNPLFPPRYVSDSPFDQEINNGVLDYQGEIEAGGVQCHVVGARTKDTPTQTAKFFIGTKDSILRRTEITFSPPTPPGSPAQPPTRITFTATGLVAGQTLGDETFRLECPEGYLKQPIAPPQQPQQGQAETLLPVGSEAPDWELRDASGKVVSLKSLRGKVVLLDFWATWCVPCKMAMPGIQKLHEKFKDKPVAVFGVNCREKLPNSNPMGYIKEKAYTYGQLVQGDTVAAAYRVTGIPCLYLIGPDGKIIYTVSGFSEALEGTLSNLIEKAIKPQT
jgi:thiol-disulfide isomerase/thioredoxin